MKTIRSLPLLLLVCLFVLLGTAKTVLAQTTYPPSETITYRDLDGNAQTLRAFSGQFVRYALPDSWLQSVSSQGLTPGELVTLISRTDELYRTMKDVIGGEPTGDGLMIIAIVPLASNPDGGGAAVLGVKTCEIGVSQLALTRQALAEGTLPVVILHEVAHTFDLHRNYLGYYADSPHSWTDFWIAYSQYLLRYGAYHSVPDVVLRDRIYDFTSKWDALATNNSWSQCVKLGTGCEGAGVSANKAIAGLLLRYARLHGRDAMRRVFEFYKNYKVTHDPFEIFNFTPEQKNDLFAEALSYGINLNMTAELDVWFWPLSTDERTKLQTLYPAPNPNVVDADHDGWTPLQGDFDDTNPNVHPGAQEQINGRDDDCDGFIDDVQRTASSTIFSPPARLIGHIRSTQSETFRFNATGTLIVRARITSGNWVGQVSIIPDGQVTAVRQLTLEPFKSNSQEWTLSGSGPWTLRIDWVSGGEGDYEVILAFLPQAESTGDVFALPLRQPTAMRAHSLVPGGLERAVVTLPNVNGANANAVPNSGNWPTNLSGFEVRVDGLICLLISLRATGNTFTIDFAVPSQINASSASRVPILVRHVPSGSIWQTSNAEVLSSAPAIWGQPNGSQSTPSALALESPNLIAFSESRRVPVDGSTRVIIFASGLGTNPSVATTRLIAELQDGRRINLLVEFVGQTSMPGLYQIVFLPDNSLSGQSSIKLMVEGSDEWVSLPLR